MSIDSPMPQNKVRFQETVAKLRTMTTKKPDSTADKVFDENQQHKLQKESSVLTKAIE